MSPKFHVIRGVRLNRRSIFPAGFVGRKLNGNNFGGNFFAVKKTGIRLLHCFSKEKLSECYRFMGLPIQWITPTALSFSKKKINNYLDFDFRMIPLTGRCRLSLIF